MKYSRTALGLLNAQYRSVLRKCFLINAGLFALGAIATATPANADEGYNLTDGQSVVLDSNKLITNTVDTEGTGRKTAILAAGETSINTGDYTLAASASGATGRNYIFNTTTDGTDFTFLGNLIASATGTGSSDNRGLRQNATSTTTWNGNINVDVQSEDGNAIGIDIWEGSTANFEGALTDISTKAGNASSNSLAVQTFNSEGSAVYLKAAQTNLKAEGSQNAQGILAYQGSVYVDGNANITAKNGTVTTRAININCDAGNPYDSVVSLKGNSAILNAISEEGYSSSIAVLSSGTPGTFSSAVENLTVNAESESSYAQGITSQYGGTVSLTEGTNTVVNATGATGAYGVASQNGWGVPGHFTSHGDLTSNANGATYAYGAFVYKDSSFTADQLTATGTATGENGQGIGALISASTDVVIGSAGKTSSLKGVASGESGVGIGLYVENGTGEASLTLNGTVTAEGAYAGVVNNSGTITNEADLTIKGGMENDGNFINNAKVASDNSFYNDSNGVITNNGDLNISGVNDSAIYNKGTITSGENAKYTFANNTATEGGAINNNGGNVSISNASFSNNKATSYGGAINNEGGSTLTVDKSTFDNNVVQSDNPASMSYGGAIRNYGTATITNSEFTNNKALKAEGATGSGVKAYSSVLFNAGTATIENTVMSNNRGDYMGGVIQNAGGNLTVKNSTIENSNYIDDENSTGASVLLSNSGNTTLSDLIVRNNIAGGEGVIDFQGAAVVTFDGNNEFSGNADTAVYNWNDSDVTFKSGSSSSFSGNKALTRTTKGGAIYNAATMTFESGASVEFTDNEAVAGGAVYNDVNGVVNFKDSATFTGNTANGAKNDIYNAGTINLTAASDSTLNLALDGGIDGSAGTINLNGAGIVDIDGAVKNQTVNVQSGTMLLDKAEADLFTSSAVNVQNGALINTIDDIANNYSSLVTLKDGASISLDADFNEGGKSDKYAAADNANITVTSINLLNELSGKVEDRAVNIATAGNISLAAGVADTIKAYTSTKNFSLVGKADNSGNIYLEGSEEGNHGLDIAVDATGNERTQVLYEITENEDFTDGDKTIENADFIIEGDNKTITAGTGVNSMIVKAESSLTMNNATMEAFNNAAIMNYGETYVDNVTFADTNALAFNNSGYMEIKDSTVNAKVINSGTLVSDPTTYTDVVENSGTASFDADTFTGTATLDNTGTVNISGGTAFESGAQIIGDGVTNLVSGTTAFNNTASSNTINLASGADWSGALASTGVVNTQNANIDTVSGSVTGGTLNIDANVAGKTIDTFGDASGAKIKSINLTNSQYGTDNTVSLSLSGASLDADYAITGGTNYFTEITETSGNIVFGNKLVNASGMHDQIGSWTAGKNISASNTYDATTKSYATDGQTVAGALTALDTAIGDVNYANEDSVAGSVLKTGSGATTTVRGALDALDTGKQNKLTAGDGITITAATDTIAVNLDTVAETTDKKVMTAAERTKLSGIAAGAQVNVIEGVQVNGADLTPDANKKVNITVAEGTTNGTIKVNGTDVAVHGLDSAAYAKTTDFDAAGTAAAAVAALDASASQTAGTDGLALSITEVDGKITAISGSIAANTYDAYGAASTAKTEAITAAEGYTDTSIAGLDATASQAAGTDGLALSITEENGKITAISGSIAANTYDAHGAASAAETAAKGYTDTSIAGLDAEVSQTAGTDGLALSITEENGKITAISGSIAANTYDAYGAAAAAQTAANTYTDTQLANYSTTTQMNNAINIAKSDAISTAAADATTKANAAKAYTDTQLTSYSTTTQMNNAINTAKSDAISTAAADATTKANAAKAYTDTQLASYSTTTQMNNAINTAKSDAISTAATDATTKANAAQTAANTYTDTSIAGLDATASQTAGTDGLALSITEENGKITAISGSIAANTYDAYGAASTAKTEAITTAEGYTDTSIAGLDASASQTAGADGLALSITEVDGKITAISGSIAANTYDAYGAASTAESNANTYTDNAIAGLDASASQAAGTDGLALSITQENGVITAISGSIAANTYDAYGAAAAVQGSTTETVESVNVKVNNARYVADDASAKADNARYVADTASSKADNAMYVANEATTKANTALDNAEQAQTAANNAQSAADAAQGTANTALANAATAQGRADHAYALAEKVEGEAAQAQTTANQAKDRADHAYALAEKVEGEAAQAQTTANQAKDRADHAYALAEMADDKADAAQQAANHAQSTADAAVAQNTVQDTGLSNIMGVIGGTYATDTGAVTPDAIDVTGYTGSTIIGAVNQLDDNFTNSTIDAKFKSLATTGDASIGGDLTVGTKFKVTAADGSFSASNDKFVVNADGAVTASNGKFVVDADGAIKASNNKFIVNTDGAVTASNGKFVVNDNGAITASNGKFIVDENGAVTAGGKVVANGFENANGSFLVDGSGNTAVGGNFRVSDKFTVDSSTGNTVVGGTLTAGAGKFTVDTSGNTIAAGKATAAEFANGSATFAVSTTGDINATSITTTGDANVGGKLSVTSDTAIGGTLSAAGGKFTVDGSGNTAIYGNTQLGGNLAVTDKFTVEGATGNTNVGGKLNVAGDVAINGNTQLGGNFAVTDKFTVDGATGDTISGGKLTAAEFANGSATFAVSTTGDINATSITTTGDANIGGDLNVTGDTTLADTTVNGDLTVTGLSHLDGGVNVNNKFTVGTDGAVSAAGGSFTIAADGKTIVGNDFAVTDKFTVEGATGNTVVGGTFAVQDKFTVDTTGNMIAAGKATAKEFANGSATFTVSDDGNVVAQNITAQGDLGVLGTAWLTNAQVSHDLAVANDATVGNDFAVAGTSNLHDTNVNGALATTGSATIGGDLGVAGSTWLKNTHVNGDLDVSGTTKTTALTFDGNSYVAAMDQGAAAITNGVVDDQAKRTMATNATVAKTVGNLAALDNTHGVTSVADVASAIDSLAANVETATGGTFTGATWKATVDMSTPVVDYTYNGATGHNNIMSFVSDLAYNIGSATTAANGNIASANSVNANLDMLDASIGDRSNIGSKNAAINAGTAANVAAGMRAVGDAIGDMNFASSHYVGGTNDLSSAVRTLDDNLYRVESDLHDLKRDFNRGMASMAAMSALVPNPRAYGNTSLAIGTGAYSGHTAAAIGGFHYLTDNIMLNAGAAWGNSSDASYRMGVTFSW